MEDLLYWGAGTKGKFSIKSALQIIRKEVNGVEDDLWDLVWKAPAQQRVRAFLWLASHDRLMGNLNRYKRKLTNDPKCFICGGEDESTLHILRDCPAAKSVWRKLEGFANLSSFYQGGLHEWIRNNLEFESIETWPTIFAISTWWLWRWRNMLMFDRRNEILLDLIAFLKVRFDETWKALHDDLGP